MPTNEQRSPRHGDNACRTCGTNLTESRFYDTRGHVYCGPECWESVDSKRNEPTRFTAEMCLT